ncbi:MAG: hypothetical protein NT076_03740 [Candidatus Pacearchaeota archaeon]|nr:hypothetical protein [Candidatus Pacearchaeota archaeon]
MKNIGEVIDRLETDRALREKDFYITFLLLFVMFLAVMLLQQAITTPECNSNNAVSVESKQELNCNNLSLQETALCLNSWVVENFNYTITDDKLNLTDEQLKTRGGDCNDYTNFYARHMRAYGFDSKKLEVFVEDDDAKNVSKYHTFLITYDKTGYCHLDMRAIECFLYSSGGDEKMTLNQNSIIILSALASIFFILLVLYLVIRKRKKLIKIVVEDEN